MIITAKIVQQMEDNQNQLDDELYESIESENTEIWGAMAHRKSSRVVEDSSEQKQVSKDVVFPEKPAQLGRMFTIYKNNAQKLNKLRSEVQTLDDTILQQMQLNYAYTHPKMEFKQQQGFEEIRSNEDSPIEPYERKRRERQNKLKQLNKLYEALNKLNQVQAFLLEEGNQQKMIEIIKETKEIISCRVVGQYLIMVCKQKELKIEKQNNKNDKMNIYQSGIFLQEPTEESEYFTIGIFDIANLKHWLNPKQPEFQVNQQQRAQVLQKCRKEAQMCVNIGQRVAVRSQYPILTAAYSQKHKLIFTHDNHNNIKVYDLHGNYKLGIQLDEADELLLLESYNDQLAVGTKEGLVRIYRILLSENNKLKGVNLENLIMCTYEGQNKINAYCLTGDNDLKKIVFGTLKHICEYDIITNIISEFSLVSQDFQNFIMKQNKWQFTLFQSLLKSNLGKQFISKLASIAIDKKQTEQLVHIFTSPPVQNKQKEYQLLLVDQEGTLRLVSTQKKAQK